MKRAIAFLTVLITVLCFASCGGTPEKEEISTYMVETEPEETVTVYVEYPTIEEMSPKTIDVEKTQVPMELPFRFNADKIRRYTPIRAEDSLDPDTYAQEIYKHGSDQYFVFSDKMAFVILTDSDNAKKRTYVYSAYYNEDGRLFYIGDDVYSWYYNEAGEVDIIAYTYYFEDIEVGTTFYDAEGKRIGAITDGLYYDADLNVYNRNDEILLLQRLGAVAEIFKEN